MPMVCRCSGATASPASPCTNIKFGGEVAVLKNFWLGGDVIR